MTKRVMQVLAAASVVVLAAGCSEDPALYLGGPPGADDHHRLSSQAMTVVVGDSVVLGARAEDATGNRTGTAPAVAACSGGIATVGSAASSTVYATSVWVRGAALGAGCLTVTSGSIVDTVSIVTGPAGVVLDGPDTVLSGSPAAFTLTAVDRAGNALTGTTDYVWSASNAALLGVNPETGEVRGKATGTVSVRLRAPGGANATRSTVVSPGVFAGSLSSTNSGPGSVITVTRATDGEFFDSDTGVLIGGVAAFVDGFSQNQLVFAVPATGTAGAQTAAFQNLGPGQVQQNTPFTVSAATTDVYSPGNTNTTISPPAGAPEVSSIMTANRNVYLVHGGFGTGAASRGAWNGGATPAPDRYLKVTTGAEAKTVTLTLSWGNGSDVDIFILDNTGTEVDNSFSGSTTQEVMTFTFPAGTTHFVGVSMWSAGTSVTNMKFSFGGL